MQQVYVKLYVTPNSLIKDIEEEYKINYIFLMRT